MHPLRQRERDECLSGTDSLGSLRRRCRHHAPNSVPHLIVNNRPDRWFSLSASLTMAAGPRALPKPQIMESASPAPDTAHDPA